MLNAQFNWPFTTVTIASGASLSGTIEMGRCNLFSIAMPAAWTAANLTFSVSIDGVNFLNLHDQSGVETSIPVAASRHIGGLDVLAYGSFSYLRIRSGTAGVPVNQAADRVLTLMLRNAGGQ